MERQSILEEEKVQALSRIARASILDLASEDAAMHARSRSILAMEVDNIKLELQVRQIELKAKKAALEKNWWLALFTDETSEVKLDSKSCAEYFDQCWLQSSVFTFTGDVQAVLDKCPNEIFDCGFVRRIWNRIFEF